MRYQLVAGLHEYPSAGSCLHRVLAAALLLKTQLGGLQVLHEEQVAAKQTLLQAAAEADDMFELLLQHRDKLTPGDQARH